MLLGETSSATFAALGMLALVVAWLLFRSQRYLARVRGETGRVTTTRYQAPQREEPRLEWPHEMIRWEVEMHDLARELSGKLDSKMGALEHLIREADRASSRLEAALDAAEARLRESTADPAPPARQAAPTGPHPACPRTQAESLGPGSPSDSRRAQLGTGTAGESPAPPPDERYREIHTLADYGYDAAEIARRVGSPVGEINLILGLRKQR